MSLIVHLPLTGDLRNLGLDGSIMTGTNVTVESSGKIGSCYSFNGSDSYLLSDSSPFSNNTDNWSYACWFKPNNHHNGCLFSCRTGVASTGMTIFYYGSGQILFDDGARWQFTPSTAITNGEWNHLVFVRKKGVGKYFYLNGNLVSSTNATGNQTTVGANYAIGNSQASNTTLYGNPLNGYLNDVRIYDHCLTPKEVKEISKGLILHYKLDNGGFGNENLLSRYVVPGQASPTSTAAGGRTTWLGDYKITIPATENADTYFRLFTTKQLTANAVYTISCKVDGLLSGSYYRFPLYAQGNTAMGVLNLDHNGLCSLTFTMTYGTQTAATGANGETVYICFMDDSGRAIASGQGAITISNFKLEEGSVVTPWCPNIRDASYLQIGVNDSIFMRSIVQYDTNIYVEPDGSKWLRIFHHNNPGSEGVFSSNNTFTTGVYKSENVWYDVEPILNYVKVYEFLVKQKTTSNATETKYRWVQKTNPLTTTWAETKPGSDNVTHITDEGYSVSTVAGGLYLQKGSSRMVISNASSGNWFGAIGAYSAYNGGIPGYPNTTVTTGYMDLYVRLPDEKEYDCSGYENDGIRTGTFNYLTDTPKYTVSTQFNGATYIEADPLPTETKSISCWINWAELPAGYTIPIFDKTSGLAIGMSANARLITYIGTASGSTGTQTNVTFSTNTWYHIVVVKTSNTTRQVYIDGQLQPSGGGNWWSADLDKLLIGCRHLNGSYTNYFKGQISDFRAYAAILSAEDVENLYRKRAYATRSSDLLIDGELQEQSNKYSIARTGVSEFEEFSEEPLGNPNILANTRTMALGSSNASTGTWRLAGSNLMTTKQRVAISSSPIGECYGFEASGIQQLTTASDACCWGIDGYPWEANTTYTVSAWARLTSGNEGYAGFFLYPATATYGDGSCSTIPTKVNYRLDSLTSSWKHIWVNFTTLNITSGNIYLGMMTGAETATIQMCGVKIEKGSTPTRWSPNVNDTEYGNYQDYAVRVTRDSGIYANSFSEI